MTDRTLSSTAFRTYWLGRYLERAASAARLVSVTSRLLIDLPMRLPRGWQPLINTLGQEDAFEKLYGELSHNSLAEHESSVCRFLLTDVRNPGSLINSLANLRENGRTLRGNLPRATFEYINGLYLNAKDSLAPPLSRTRRDAALQSVVEQAQQIEGFLSANMLHNADWHFTRLGNFIERADMTTRTIDIRTTSLQTREVDLTPFEDIQWRSVLQSMYAMQNYTSSVQRPVNREDVLEFLFKNPELPRSLARCFATIRNCLRALPNNREPLEQINKMRRQLQRANVRRLEGEKLHRFVEARQRQLDVLHNSIARTYFQIKRGKT